MEREKPYATKGSLPFICDLQDEGFDVQTLGYGKVFLFLTVNILGFSIGNYCRTLRGIWFRTTMWMNCLLAIILVASAYKRQYYSFFISVSEY